MKQSILLLSSLLITGVATSQEQFENGDMELWENLSTPTEEPTEWSSLKTADALAGSAPQVVSQDVGRGGGFSAKLESTSVFSIPANGIMTNGRVHADFDPDNGYVYTETSDSKWNTDFTSRPDSLIGWYKYSPAGGDKGKVEVFLHEAAGQIPAASTAPNIIGSARMNITTAQTEWTRFAVPFSYVDGRTPEKMLSIVACGDSTISNSGSILWIDDLAFTYSPTSELTEADLNLKVFSHENIIELRGNGAINNKLTVFDVSGDQILQVQNENFIQTNFSEGIYIIEVTNEFGTIRKKLFLK